MRWFSLKPHKKLFFKFKNSENLDDMPSGMTWHDMHMHMHMPSAEFPFSNHPASCMHSNEIFFFQVALAELERLTHPSVADAAVTAQPDLY